MADFLRSYSQVNQDSDFLLAATMYTVSHLQLSCTKTKSMEHHITRIKWYARAKLFSLFIPQWFSAALKFPA